MSDPRNKKLADLFLDHSIKLKKGDRLVITSSNLEPSLDILRECYKGALQRGALVYLDILGLNLMINRSSVGDFASIFYEYASGEQLTTVPKPYDAIMDWATASIRLTSFDNKSHLANADGAKVAQWSKAHDATFKKILKKKWTLTRYPVLADAQDAHMSFTEYEDFYFSSCLVDYKKMERELQGLATAIDRGSVVRIKGYRTDLTLGIKGRTAQPCIGTHNVPDGEVFTGPEENKTEGYIYYDFPGSYSGKVMNGISLEFKAGKVVKATAETNDAALQEILKTDAGALRFGEFAIGANYNIKNFMYNTLFDEKIGGTIHTALGMAYNYPKGWGKNKSAIHWDIVKDTRKKGSEVWIDKKLVLKDGKILV